MAANETKSIGSLKAYGSAQGIYRRRNGVFADDFHKLYDDGTLLKLLDKSIVDADGPDAPPYSGYYLIELSRGLDHESEYAIASHPSKYEESGVLSFYTDQQGTIWQKDLAGETIDARLTDPAAQGWTPTGN